MGPGIRKAGFALPALFLLFAVCTAGAEEFILKDGTKIVGKIVGYETDSFRVETSFGIAMIYKDKIERIIFADAGAPAATTAAPKKEAPRAVPPPEPPKPEKIVEHVSGTEYVNETYRFRFFKPPSWRSYPEMVRPQTPMIAALGTPDESTLLFIGRETHNGNLDDYAKQAEGTLRQFYSDYRKQSERPVDVAGMPGIERSFSGQAEGQFWNGVAIYVARGPARFTFIGLSTATEMGSFGQAILRRVLNSVEFLPDEGATR